MSVETEATRDDFFFSLLLNNIKATIDGLEDGVRVIHDAKIPSHFSRR